MTEGQERTPEDVVQSVFSKQSILKKQQESREAYEKQVTEMRQTMERLAATEDGETFLKYLFLLCGGDKGSIRRDRQTKIDIEDTLVTLGAKSVYETIRFNLSSDVIKKIERHDWEK